MNKRRHPIQLATIQTYLFTRALRRMVREAEAELEARGIERDYRPVLDQLAAVENLRR